MRLMLLHHDPSAPVLLAGGGGVVGRRLAPLLIELDARPLLIGGRSAERAEHSLSAVRAAGGEAHFVALDLAAPPAAEALSVSAVVGLVNDPQDRLLSAPASAGVPYVDITRWTTRLASAIARVALTGARAPLVFASGWMGGLLPRVAALLAHELGGAVDAIEGAIRYALADASGADSVEYVDRLWIPFDVTQDGCLVTVRPLADARRVTVVDRATVVRRLDTPEQWTLPLTLGASSVAVRLGLDSPVANSLLGLLSRIRFFRWFASERFRDFRRSLLWAPGTEARAGAPAAFRVDVTNRDGARRGMSLVSSRGQAQLTAVGAWLGLRYALAQSTRAGVHFPEQDPENAALCGLLERAGVSMVRSWP